ncbi:MAG: class A beta-lactamase-related serine hydrolase [Defluviitaleaceae bacterium]|nr:class A beta-lactamase-related serine hydrolase [Defluviitaleaceae bacterium]
MDNRTTDTKRKNHKSAYYQSLPLELLLGVFFISILLAIAFVASNLNMPAVIAPNGQFNSEAEAEIRPLVRPISHYENTSGTSAETPAEDIPENTAVYQPADTYNPSSQITHTPSTTELDAFFSQFGAGIGIYYKNLETGFVYTFNPDTVFFGASLNKAQYALYIHIAAERGYIDMYALHTFAAADWWGGTGIIRFMPAGARLTTRELLRHSVVYSDNVAHRMLARYMANISFSYRDFVKEIGANPDLIRNTYAHYTTAADTAIWFYALHTYLESDNRYGHYLMYDLLNTALYSHPYFTRGRIFGGDSKVNVRLMHFDYPAAQKYGWAVESFNVAGIVYAPSPFMLAIISDMDYGAHDLFKEISLLMQDFNARYFYAR